MSYLTRVIGEPIAEMERDRSGTDANGGLMVSPLPRWDLDLPAEGQIFKLHRVRQCLSDLGPYPLSAPSSILLVPRDDGILPYVRVR